MLSSDIRAAFDKHCREHNFSGAARVSRGVEVLFEDAYGMAHRGFRVPNTVDTRFDTASITKLFTAVAVLQLVDAGKLRLDARALDLLDLGGTSISPEATVYHLLTHTSGMGDDADEEAGEDYEELWKTRPNYSVRHTSDMLEQFIHKPANFRPGQGCRYNNCAFVLLGLVLEKLTGKGYREHVADAVFRAAGMSHTGFFAMDEPAPGVAEGYAAVCDDAGNVVGWRKNIYSFPPIGSPDSGAYTTAGDLDTFMRALRGARLLSPGMTAQIMTPKEEYRRRPALVHMTGFAFEFTVSIEGGAPQCMFKDGVNPGVACVLQYYPAADATVAVLANQDCDVWALARDIRSFIEIP